MLFFSEWTTCP